MINCTVCDKEIPADEHGMLDRCARIQRGDFSIDGDEDDNIKFEIYICTKCFMDDPLLCVFFNEHGYRVR